MVSLLQDVTGRLSPAYGKGEGRAMARRLLEEGLGLGQTEIFSSSLEQLDDPSRCRLEEMVARILGGEPLQYVIGYELFCSLPIKVGPGVLIPRPETEDLVQMVLDRYSQGPAPLILDACTGSGAIAIALSCRLGAHADAVDISPEALSWARRNVRSNNADVTLVEHDISTYDTASRYDVLVSNPPYVLEREKMSMEDNVLGHEPHLALFVPDDDPLLFYRMLLDVSDRLLRPGGEVFLETNTAFSSSVSWLFRNAGYEDAEVARDRFGLDRIVHAKKTSQEECKR